MGCDIHTKAETSFTYDGEEHWSMITDHVFPSPYYRAAAPVTRSNVPYSDSPYSGRNYRLFGFLADVRNGRGFAGIDTGESVEPILGFDHPTRGVPDNASDEWKKYVEEWGADLHSTSWLTLRELKAAKWDTRIIQRGVISARSYEEIRATSFEAKPTSWSGDVGGGGVHVLTPEEYEALRIEKGWTGPESHPSEFSAPVSYFVRWQWEDTMRSFAEEFLTLTIPALEANAPRIGQLDRGTGRSVYRGDIPDPRPIDEDGIRLVFGFDN